MEDRNASLVAVGLGCLAIGGFWVARPSMSKATIQVLEQRNIPVELSGEDHDAATIFRLKLPPAVLEAQEEKATMALQIVDRLGRVYPLLPMSNPAFIGTYKLQKGYATAPEEPRLQAVVNGTVLSNTPIASLPLPKVEGLVATPNPFLAIVYHDGWLEAVPRGRIPRGEQWRVIARRTQFAKTPDAWAMLPGRGLRWPSSCLRIPFGEQAGAVEVEVTRYRSRETSDVLEIPGIRLDKRLGGTALIVDKTISIPNSLGTEVRLPRQYAGPYRPLRRGDSRTARALLTIFSGPALFPSDGKAPDPLTDRRTTGEILSPSPESLGLKELQVGPAVRRAMDEPAAELRRKPFTALVRINVARPIEIERFTAVIPVEVGSNSKHLSTVGVGFPSFGPPRLFADPVQNNSTLR